MQGDDVFSDEDDEVRHDFDDGEEIWKHAELVCTHKAEKRFPDWISIACARAGLEDDALQDANLNAEDDPTYKQDPEYMAASEDLRRRYPALMTIKPGLLKYLNWIALNSSALEDWYEKLDATKQEALTSPRKIKQQFDKSLPVIG